MFNHIHFSSRRLGAILTAIAFSAVGASAATRPQNTRFINQACEDLLGRPADRLSTATYDHFLAVGGTRTQLAGILTGSSEYRTRLVQQFYEEFLNRPAAPGEVSFGAGLLQQGGTDSQLRGLILAGQEYFTHAGGTNEGFLTKLFQDLLGRPIDRGTLSSLLTLMSQGYTRAMVADAILKSVEYEQKLVQQFYQKFLRRPADPAGLAAYTQVLQNGIKEEVVVDSLVGSDEYFRLANQ